MSSDGIDPFEFNRAAWDREVQRGNVWTVPVGPEVIAAARRGELELLLTPQRPVPRDWIPPLAGLRVLCLAGGGGQQAPVLAAAGAQVTVLDCSPLQLEQDRRVARREGLELELVAGDMRDLSRFADGCFDLVVHPIANVFVPDVRPVWREASRVLRPGGLLLAGFINPAVFVFDLEAAEKRGVLVVRHRLPYADLTSLAEPQRGRRLASGDPLEFGHTLEDQLGGQLEAGLALTGFLEDRGGETLLDAYMPTCIATRAQKPRR
jgi:SAM-dependent methyltransferase